MGESTFPTTPCNLGSTNGSQTFRSRAMQQRNIAAIGVGNGNLAQMKANIFQASTGSSGIDARGSVAHKRLPRSLKEPDVLPPLETQRFNSNTTSEPLTPGLKPLPRRTLGSFKKDAIQEIEKNLSIGSDTGASRRGSLNRTSVLRRGSNVGHLTPSSENVGPKSLMALLGSSKSETHEGDTLLTPVSPQPRSERKFVRKGSTVGHANALHGSAGHGDFGLSGVPVIEGA